MLKLDPSPFLLDANPKYADYYETALYNHILGQQDPESGMVAYFLPLLSGAHKVYSTPEHSFWCCVGTGFENHAKYGEAIYYRADNALYVNLFIPSELTWEEKGLKVRQETNFPQDGKINMNIGAEKPVKLAIKIRYPAWTQNVEVKVNGKKISVKQSPSSYIVVERTWNNGDKIEINYPMSLQVAETNDNPDVFAEIRSVYWQAMGTEGMHAPAPFSDPHRHNDYYTYDYHVPLVTTALKLDKKDLNRYIKLGQ